MTESKLFILAPHNFFSIFVVFVITQMLGEEYYPIADLHYEKPRYLNREEISYITTRLTELIEPYCSGAQKDLIKDTIISTILKDIMDSKLVPSWDILEKLIEEIRQAHMNSIVPSGKPVGNDACDGMGSTATQMTLNTFHFSGQAKSVSSDIKKMKALLVAAKKSLQHMTIVHFRKKDWTLREILSLRAQVEESTVITFTKAMRVAETKDLPPGFFGQRYVQKYAEGKKWNMKRIKESTHFLELTLDMNIVRKYNTSVHGVANAIFEDFFQKKGSSVLHWPFPTPTVVGKVYVFPNIETINAYFSKKDGASLHDIFKGVGNELKEKLYLESSLGKTLSFIRVSGIRGMSEFTPKKRSFASFLVTLDVKRYGTFPTRDFDDEDIYREIEGGYYDSKRVYRIQFNDSAMRSAGITRDYLLGMIERMGIKVLFRYSDSKNGTVSKVYGSYFLVFVKDRDPLSLIFSLSPDSDLGDSFVKSSLETMSERFFTLKTVKGADKENISKEIGKFGMTMEVQSNDKVLIEISEEVHKTWLNYTPIEILSKGKKQYYWAEVRGYNLQDLLKLRSVDQNCTRCTSIRDTSNAFGIENAKMSNALAIGETISGAGNYINAQHLYLVSSLMTKRGVPTGADFTGIGTGTNGHIALSIIERAQFVFTRCALKGSVEGGEHISGAIVGGSRVRTGTGSFDVMMKKRMRVQTFKNGVMETTEKIEELRNDEIFEKEKKVVFGDTDISLNSEATSMTIDEFAEDSRINSGIMEETISYRGEGEDGDTLSSAIISDTIGFFSTVSFIETYKFGKARVDMRVKPKSLIFDKSDNPVKGYLKTMEEAQSASFVMSLIQTSFMQKDEFLTNIIKDISKHAIELDIDEFKKFVNQ